MTSRSRFIMSVTRFFSQYHMPQIANNRIIQDRRLISREYQALGHRYISNIHRRIQLTNRNTRNFRAYSNVPSSAPLPSRPPINRSRWILGIIVTLVLPFATNKWGPLLKIKNEIDNTVETIEEVVEVVEKVAEVVDRVAENISGKLPADGKLKEVVEFVENVAEETVKDAHAVENAIDKFQEAEKKVENIVEALSPEATRKQSA